MLWLMSRPASDGAAVRLYYPLVRTGGEGMSNKLAYALMVIIVIGAVVWGLVSYNDLARTRSELNVLRIEVEALERDLAQT